MDKYQIIDSAPGYLRASVSIMNKHGETWIGDAKEDCRQPELGLRKYCTAIFLWLYAALTIFGWVAVTLIYPPLADWAFQQSGVFWIAAVLGVPYGIFALINLAFSITVSETPTVLIASRFFDVPVLPMHYVTRGVARKQVRVLDHTPAA